MAFTIPAGHKAIYDEVVTALINSEWAIVCKINQPAKKTECPNCLLNTLSNTSSGVYKFGGPIAFDDGGICPYCNGDGYVESVHTDNVRMMIYWDANQYARELNIPIRFPDGTIASKGLMGDYTKIDMCDNMVLHNGIPNSPVFTYIKAGQPTPFGIGKDSFFVCYWKRT